MLYTAFVNKAIIKGTLITIDPLHIGAASKDSLNPVELDSAVLKDPEGNPVIPGSSIKGAVRSQFESILRLAKEVDKNIRVCNIHDVTDTACVSKDYADELAKKNNMPLEEKAQLYYDQCCDVCKLFGGRHFAGKLHFKDCSYIGSAPCIFEKRDGVGIDRDTGAAKRKVKYDFEIVPKGTKFDFFMIAENLDENQEKYLELVLNILRGKGITDEDYLAIGGKTTRGLGRIKLEKVETSKMSAETYREKIMAFLSPEKTAPNGGDE